MFQDAFVFKDVRDRLLVFAGLNEMSDPERYFITDTNLRIGMILAVVILVLETYMLSNNFDLASNPQAVAKVGWDWVLQHRIAYLIRLGSAALLLAGGLVHILRRPLNLVAANVLIAQGIAVGLIFGMYVTCGDIHRGNGLYVIITEIVTIGGLYFIRPIISVPVSVASLLLTMVNAQSAGMLSHGITLNLHNIPPGHGGFVLYQVLVRHTGGPQPRAAGTRIEA